MGGIMLGFGKPDIKKLEEKNDVKGLIKALKYKRGKDLPGKKVLEASDVRGEAAEALGIIGDKRAVDPLIKTLKDKDHESVQIKAMVALGKLGDPRAVEPIIQNHNFRYSPYVVEAVQVLGSFKDPRALRILRIRLNDQEWEVRIEAARVLGAIGDTESIDPIIKNMRGPYNGFDGKDYCGEMGIALGEIADSSYIETLKNLLMENKDDEGLDIGAYRYGLVLALGKIGDPSVVNFLLNEYKNHRNHHYYGDGILKAINMLKCSEQHINTALNYFDFRCSSRTVVGINGYIPELLDSMGWTPTKDEYGAMYYINKTPEDEHGPHSYLKRKSYENAAAIVGEPAVKPLIRELEVGYDKTGRHIGDIHVNDGAIRALVMIGEPAVEPLINALNNYKTSERGGQSLVERGSAKALGMIGDTRAVEPLTKKIESDSYKEALEALRNIGGERAMETLQKYE